MRRPLPTPPNPVRSISLRTHTIVAKTFITAQFPVEPPLTAKPVRRIGRACRERTSRWQHVAELREDAIKIPAPVQDEKVVEHTHRNRGGSVRLLLGRYRGVYEHVRGVKQVASATRAAQRVPRSTKRSAAAIPGMLNPYKSPSTRRRSATAVCCSEIFFSVVHNPTQG